MDKSEAIVSVDDAIRKLVQLSSKEKVWAQEMLLQVNDQCLRLLDVETQVWPARGSCRPGPRLRGLRWGLPVGRGRMRRAKVGRGRGGGIQANPAHTAPRPPLAPALSATACRVWVGVWAPSPTGYVCVCVHRTSPPSARGCEPASVGTVRGCRIRKSHPGDPRPAASEPPPSPLSRRRSWRTSRCPPCGTARRCPTSRGARRCCCSCARTRSRANPTSTSSTATRWR